MFSERDDFGSRRPIIVLSAADPILIIEEQQKMGKKTGATRRATKQFKPLFSLNYSATHKEHHNNVFELDPLDAYNERLVKRIEVKGIEMVGMRGTDGYVYLQDIKVSPKHPPRAVIEFTQQLKSGSLKRTTRTFDELDNIYQASGELETYAHGYRILRIVPDQNGQTGYVEFDNHERLYRGQVANDSSEEDLRRIQIRETIASHLQKEEVLFRQGIKCLSLFFIDEVAKYRVYDEDGSEGVGEYGRIFEEEYARAISERASAPTLDDAYDPAYLRYLRSFDAHEVHKGYFSIDKKGRACNSKLKRGSEFAEGEDAVAAYDLILKNKERLLSFDEPCRFIFSHSALREGWDNPNVFQICTLKNAGGSDIAKRQEVGRGLRLCVNQNGVRQDEAFLGRDGVHCVNLLTVIASEGYDSYVKSFQKENANVLRPRPQRVEEKLFGRGGGAGRERVHADGRRRRRSRCARDASSTLRASSRTSSARRACCVPDGDIPEHLDGFLEQIERIVRSAEDPSVVIENGLRSKVPENKLNDNFHKREFQQLWERINHKHAYTVEFDTEELRRKAVASIDANLTVSKPRYRLKQGAQRAEATREQLEASEGFGGATSAMLEVNSGAVSNVAYDLVGEVPIRRASRARARRPFWRASPRSLRHVPREPRGVHREGGVAHCGREGAHGG